MPFPGIVQQVSIVNEKTQICSGFHRSILDRRATRFQFKSNRVGDAVRFGTGICDERTSDSSAQGSRKNEFTICCPLPAMAD